MTKEAWHEEITASWSTESPFGNCFGRVESPDDCVDAFGTPSCPHDGTTRPDRFDTLKYTPTSVVADEDTRVSTHPSGLETPWAKPWFVIGSWVGCRVASSASRGSRRLVLHGCLRSPDRFGATRLWRCIGRRR